MRDQPRYETFEASDFFPDGQASRPLVEGVVPYRGEWRENEAFETGKREGEFVAQLPLEVTRELLLRGQDRFNIYCSMCHAYTGEGDGMIVRRGLRRPPSYHIDRLREAPVGHFFDVITNGFGAMPSYKTQIPVRDRWAIVAYVRALQLSRHAEPGDVPANERAALASAEAQP
jgi:hypothetical protein